MYKPRFSFKNMILNINTINAAVSTAFSSQSSFKFKFEKILVVSKLSLYEYERNKYKNLNEEQFKKELRDRGTDVDRLAYFYHLHKDFEAQVIKHLKTVGVDVKVVNRTNYTNDVIDWADVIMPTGGDGTFLLAASRIRNNEKPVIGFNSDPNRSEGHLCLPKQYSVNILEAIKRLQSSSFNWLLRSRIRTTFYEQKSDIVPTHLHLSDAKYEFYPPVEDGQVKNRNGTVLPFLALNEVFIGEGLSARVSYLEMCLDEDEQPTNMKCSGLCVSTGTGSTSWHLSINRIPVQTVAELLKLIDFQPTAKKESLASTLTDIYNKNLIFKPDDNQLGYTIRDLISAGVWPQPKGIKSRGFASKIKVKSKCIDACLVVDGGISVPFNDGCTAVLEIKPEDALRTIVLAN